MKPVTFQVADILDVCIAAGRVMLANGAETYRVEDTLQRIAKSYNLHYVNVFVVPTAIILTVQGEDGQDHTELLRMTEQQTNLEKVALVNNLSRQLAVSPYSPEIAKEKIREIEEDSHFFSETQRLIAVSIACGSFSLLFGGVLADFIPATIAGGVGYLVYTKIEKLIHVTFFAEMVASFLIGILALVFTSLQFGQNLDMIIIGGVMGLVPGMAITNSFRDLMAGHLLAGISVAAQAILTASAIGIGIALVLTFL
ncbi:threonine/serine exporter family protein [Lacticigenium naphthae]|uniref:threonine/serine exporter family protein n=1 Tax=Lacticigenium naphthae TaxID=515351 RepID=UPI000410A62E|nr:threonine/serine exporter family protein [Lacticigenium naphthae]